MGQWIDEKARPWPIPAESQLWRGIRKAHLGDLVRGGKTAETFNSQNQRPYFRQYRNLNSHFESAPLIFCCLPLRNLHSAPYNRGQCFPCEGMGCEMSLLAASNAIGVLVADSNRMQAQLLTNALRRRPEFEVASCPVDFTTILESVAASLPRVALVVPGPASIAETVATLRNFHLAHPGIAKVLLVDSCDRDLVVSAFRSGTRGIFPITDSDLRQLCKCIQRVAAGQIWANTEQLNYLLETISEVPAMRVLNTKGASLLTPREEQVVALVVEGMGNRLIARELSLSEHTIKKYLFRIFEKLGISSRVELVLYALSNGEVRRAEWIAAGPQISPPAA